jgi:hypothetical protein
MSSSVNLAEIEGILDKIIDDEAKITCEVYGILNKVNQMWYVGQTRTHRLNHGRYRPYGYKKRFDCHISGAMTEHSNCAYIRNDVVRYGADNFEVHLLARCPVDQADDQEAQHIVLKRSLYPDGYNLTAGGRHSKRVSGAVWEKFDVPTTFVKRLRTDKRSAETKQKMSENAFNRTDEGKANLSRNAFVQHSAQKFERFKDLDIDFDNVNQYLYNRTDKGKPNCRVLVGTARSSGTCTTFYGGSVEESRDKAKNFLIQLREHKAQLATSSNCGEASKP